MSLPQSSDGPPWPDFGADAPSAPRDAGAHDARLPSYTLRQGHGGLWLLAPSGRRLLNLMPEIMVIYEPVTEELPPAGGLPPAGALPPARRPRRLRFDPLQLHEEPTGSLQLRGVARDDDAEHQLSIEIRPADPRLHVSYRVDYRRELVVQTSSIVFHAPQTRGAVVLDRAYEQVPVHRLVHVDALTPHRLTLAAASATPVSLLESSGFEALRAEPDDAGNVLVELELVNQANHPLLVQDYCLARPRRRRYPARRHALSGGWRRPGDHDEAQLTWAVGRAIPLRPARYPSGFRAAMVLSDHADQSTTARAEALAFGRTGAVARGELGPTFPGYLNRGLSYTKTIFLKQAGNYTAQFDDRSYRQLLDRMVAEGVEVGVHSPGGKRDEPQVARRLLEEFRAHYAGRTWIDHQPETNCEAVTNQGWDSASPWYMLKHLHELGFRYLWSGADLLLPPGTLNLFAPSIPAARRPLLFQHDRIRVPEGSFVLFNSTKLFIEREALLRQFAPHSLDRLVAEHGLLLGHVYLDTGKTRGRYGRRSLIEEEGPDLYRLRPEIDELLARLQQRQQRGELWVTGVDALATHLFTALGVGLAYRGDGRVEVQLPPGATRPLHGLTLQLAAPEARVLVDGRPPAGWRERQGLLEFWFDLEPGQPRVLQLCGEDGAPLELLTPAQIVVR